MNRFKPTEAQRRAITSIDRSVCVRAGAGTGKTSVLVGRYMELLRKERVPVREIAALTYTEKAAKVMKDRIRTQCFAEEMNASKGDDAAWWRRQRIDLETANITTIHGFCSRLLSEHPVEAGVDPHFTVLDEVEQSVLMDRCIDDVLRQKLEAEDAEVLALCLAFPPRSVRGMLAAMMSDRARTAEAVAHVEGRSDEQILSDLRRMLLDAQAHHVDWVIGELRRTGRLKQLCEAECTDPADKLDVLRGELLRMVDELAKADTGERKVELASKMREAINLRVGSRARWAEGQLASVRGVLREIKEMLDEVPGGEFGREVSDLDEESLRLTRALISLYRSAGEAYASEKAQGGYVDFDDLLLGARRLLRERADVRARIRKQLRYLLVDELQDSALIDRDIILLLVRDEKVFQKSGDVRILPGRLFVVGDDKQSIYRFRGAEVTVFREFTERMSGEGELVELDVSFRTVPRGVTFANDLFGRLLGREETSVPYQNRYFDLTASRRQKSAFLEVMVPEPEPEESASEARAREARMIAARIERMVGEKEKLVFDAGTNSPRAVQFGDIAVLFRAMTQAHVYESAFREAGLPYYIHAGSGFYRAQEIMDMLTVLKALERPRDRVALVGTLRSPLFGISDETLFFLEASHGITRRLEGAEDLEHVTADQRRGLIDAREILDELVRVKNRVPISRLLQEVLARTGYDALLLTQFMGRQKLANVEKLIDLARSFEAKGLFTLDEFIRYIEEFVDVEARESERAAEEESSNVVRLMSVHRAKGLEFPVVFVADMSHRRHGGGPPLAMDAELGLALNVQADDHADDRPVLYDVIRREDRRRDEAERLRLLYVALTRARDHLVLSGTLARGKPPRGTWLALLSGQYGLVDDSGAVQEELVFGKERHHVPVHTLVPELPEDRAPRGRHAPWKVVRRLDRLAGRIDQLDKAPPFERSRYVEPVALDVHLKRRFVASEFAEYRYCPRRYRLSRISGVLSPEVKAPGGKGLPNGLLLGTVVHRVLAAWDFGDESSLDAALEAVLRGEALSETEEGGLLRAEAKRMIASAKRAGAFAEIAAVTERMNEYPLAARIDDFVVEGVADSVHRLADGTFEVVDYKTDRVESREVAQKAEHYELQLACYAWALAKSGLNVSRASLIFVRPAKGHAWTCDAAQLEKWEEQLRRCVADIRSGSFNEMREGPCRCGYCGWLCDRERADDGDFDLAGDDIEQSEPE